MAKLHTLAHARAGDKGDISDISVIALRPEDYTLIAAQLTAQRVRDHLGVAGAVERHELPQLHALKFVLHGALAGGVTRSTALDPHGKALAASLLDLDLDPDPTQP